MIISGQRLHAASAVVHEGEVLCQTVVFGGVRHLGDTGMQLCIAAETGSPIMGQALDEPPACIVPRITVTVTGISETDDQPHRIRHAHLFRISGVRLPVDQRASLAGFDRGWFGFLF